MSPFIQKDIINTLTESFLSWIMKSIITANYAKGQKCSSECKECVIVQLHVNHPLYSNVNSDLWRTNWKWYLIQHRCAMGQLFNSVIAVLWHRVCRQHAYSLAQEEWPSQDRWMDVAKIPRDLQEHCLPFWTHRFEFITQCVIFMTFNVSIHYMLFNILPYRQLSNCLWPTWQPSSTACKLH